MKFTISLVIIAFCIVLGTLGAAPSDPSSVLYKENISFVQNITPSTDKNGATNFSWFNAKGKTVSLNDYKGKVVFINFWGTWCPPCRRELPDIVALSKQYKGKVQFIGIALERSKENVLENLYSFAKGNGMEYEILVGTQELANAYGGITGVPTTFIVDKSGKIVASTVGMQSRDAFEKMIKEAL
ncbi:MAG TPA: TlpA disulfide reductase family protein [Candidatus Kapabacteria bacterium]|nr:TlpA disulfide reductase family protein [Candidatus Kapabacteria bacterium]